MERLSLYTVQNKEKQMPKISVIIPVYNVEPYLRKCLDSVIHQTLTDLEIICVNDGSTDGSLAILEEYAPKDSRITIINQENQGIGNARNAGLDKASGKYIYFIDSDDWVEPDTLQKCITIMEEDSEIDLVGFGAFVEKEKVDDEQVKGAQQYHSLKNSGLFATSPENIRQMVTTVWNKIFKTEIIKKYQILFPEGLWYEDNAFYYEYYLHTKKIYILNEYLYHYLQRVGSIMWNTFQKKLPHFGDRLRIFDHIYKHYQKYDQLENYACVLNSLWKGYLAADYYDSQNNPEVLIFATKLAKSYDHRYIDLEYREFLRSKKCLHFFRKVKYKNGKKITRYFGGIIKKVKGEKSKKIYLFGVQIFHKHRKEKHVA
jgi:glycosyltransferase involved in cell wall biosynthesis